MKDKYYVRNEATGIVKVYDGYHIMDWHKYKVLDRCTYSGLSDKNNKKLFIGDIVTIPSRGLEFTCEIIMECDGVDFKMITKFSSDMDHMFYSPILEEMEYIGNIYQNPELIEEVK